MPLEVIIPFEDFVNFIEANGLDLTDEAKTDLEAGRIGNFVSLGDLERQLGI